MINDILDYSKIEAGKLEIVPEKFQTLSMINDMYEIIKARNNNKLELRLDMSENMPAELNGDIVRIKQVMINFCTNAIKYTDEGFVEISIKLEKESDNTGRFIFSVKDTGIGIKEKDIQKLFKQYGQVDKTVNHHKEGTGLGLMISKQLIEAMNGNVSVESVYGEGSTFSFKIPLQVENWTPAGKLEDYQYEDKEEKQDLVFIAPTAQILVVDDIPLNLAIAKPIIISVAYQVLYKWLPKDKIIKNESVK